MLFTRFHPLIFFSILLTLAALLYSVSNTSRIKEHYLPDINSHHASTKYMTSMMPSPDELVEAVIGNGSPNVPFKLLFDNMKATNSSKNVSLPSPFDININNKVWQVAGFKNASFFAFGAYFDDRPLALREGRPLVRILGLSYLHNMDRKVDLTCLFWYETKLVKPLFRQVKVVDYLQLYMEEPSRGIDPKTDSDFLKPYLLSCPVPQGDIKLPVAVSLCYQDSCHSVDNCLKINNERPLHGQKEDLAVCVKELEYPLPNMSVRLVEWIELTRILGGSKIYMYAMHVHHIMEKVLSYYSDQGIIDVKPYRLAHFQLNFPKELLHFHKDIKFFHRGKQQIVVHTDCILRNMHKYNHIAVLDIDEIILPVIKTDQMSLLHGLKNSFKGHSTQDIPPSHYIFKNMYFLSSFANESNPNYLQPPMEASQMPSYLHTMRHVVRSAHPVEPPKLVKSIVTTDQVLAMYQHFPMHCLGGPCHGHVVNESIAFLAHYRHSCSFMIDECKELEENRVVDTTIWKYCDSIQGRIEKALLKLDL